MQLKISFCTNHTATNDKISLSRILDGALRWSNAMQSYEKSGYLHLKTVAGFDCYVNFKLSSCNISDEESDEEPFEVGADGKIRLRDGKKKIDLSKITDEDLRKLGIDPTLSKKEIAKLLKVGRIYSVFY